MSAWLGRQRKPELVALGERAGLRDLDGLRKEELVALLDEHFTKNSTSLSGNAVFKEYYDRAGGSPVKRAPPAPPAAGPTSSSGEAEAKPKVKRAPKVKKDADGATDGPSSPLSSSLTPHVPKIKLPTSAPSLHSNLVRTFPPSPSVLTDAIDSQTRHFSNTVSKALTATHLEKVVNDMRASVSSIVGFETAVFLVELICLEYQVVPWRHATDIPAIPQFNIAARPVYVPDFFILLTDVYWSTFFLYTLVSLWIPLTASWVFNFTMRPVTRGSTTVQKPRWQCDPFTFNVTKALMAWLVFTQKVRFFGLFADITVLAVMRSMPAGYPGLIIGSSIGVLASIYDAAQRK